VKFERSQEDTLLDFMEVNEYLWNPGHGEWMKWDMKENGWNNIGEILQCDRSEVRTWWNSNKDKFEREHKKSKSGSATKLLSACMQWLMTHLSFYSKVVTHHQKSVVLLKSACAEREGCEPSPVPEDEPDELTTMSKVVTQIEEHLKAAQKQQLDLLKPRSEQDAYGLYVSTWLAGLGGQAFDNARTVINNLIARPVIQSHK